MARRIDRIEKEVGYCEIKLEKERRLRKQIAFLRDDIEALDGLVSLFDNSLSLPTVMIGRSGDSKLPPRPSREEFLAAGLLEMASDERHILNRELEALVGRLKHFSDFEDKRTYLEQEKRSALNGLSPNHSLKLRRINGDLKKVERQWNSLTEDLLNLDEGIFFLERNLDYLRSARTFLITAKGSFDIESWIYGGYRSDLFRHSSIGRTKEMADGADRNLKMAQKELVCVSNVKIRADQLQRVLWTLLGALYEDLYVEGRFQHSLQVVEAVLAGNLKLLEHIRAKRELLSSRLEQAEKSRNEIFSRLGSDQRKKLVG